MWFIVTDFTISIMALGFVGFFEWETRFCFSLLLSCFIYHFRKHWPRKWHSFGRDFWPRRRRIRSRSGQTQINCKNLIIGSTAASGPSSRERTLCLKASGSPSAARWTKAIDEGPATKNDQVSLIRPHNFVKLCGSAVKKNKRTKITHITLVWKS